jgi:hypothetical protein
MDKPMRIPRFFILVVLFLVSACGTSTPGPTVTLPVSAIPSTPTELPTVAAVPTETSVPTSVTVITLLIDDFEASETAWKAGSEPDFSDSSATDLALTGEHATQGKQALQLNFEQNDRPKAIFFLDKSLDLSQAHFLQFDLFNPGSLGGVGFALTTGTDKVWYESDSVPVGAGKQASLSFDLTAATYKAASTNWEFRAAIPDLNNVSRLAIILYPAQSGSVFLDTIRIGNAP